MKGERRIDVAPVQLEDGWVTQKYSALADAWAGKIRRLGFTRAYRAVCRRIARLYEPRGRDGVTRIADIGVGAGDATLSMASALTDREVEAHGVDASVEMLRVAAERHQAAGIAFTSHCCDMCSTSLPDGHADIVIAAHSVEHLEDPGRALEEIDRILAPGGLAVLIMTRCTIPTITIEAQWPIHCVRSDLLHSDLTRRGYEQVRVMRFPFAVVPNLLSFVCVAVKPAFASGQRP